MTWMSREQDALPGEPDELFVHSGIYGGYLGQWPDNGTLSQTVPTTAGQKLLVSFWLTSVPYQGDDRPEWFRRQMEWFGAFHGHEPARVWLDKHAIRGFIGRHERDVWNSISITRRGVWVWMTSPWNPFPRRFFSRSRQRTALLISRGAVFPMFRIKFSRPAV